jgi:hypothetical protein
MMPSFVVVHPLQLPAGRDLSGPHITKGITWSKRFNQQDLPVGDNYFTNSRYERLLATRFLLLKSNKEYVLTFKILAQVLVSLLSSILAI